MNNRHNRKRIFISTLFAILAICLFVVLYNINISNCHNGKKPDVEADSQEESLKQDEISSESELGRQDEVIYLKHFSSVDEMKRANVVVGDEVITDSYYYNCGIGGAKYIITDQFSPDIEYMFIRLDNGLFAKIDIENETVNVAQFGAKGDGVHDDTQAIQNALFTQAKVIFPQNRTFVLTSGLIIPSYCRIDGNGSTLKINSFDSFFYDDSCVWENGYKGIFYYQFFMPADYYGTSELLEWNNIKVEWNVTKKLSHVKTYYLFRTRKTKQIRFTNVKVDIKGLESNCVQPFAFVEESDNILFEKCMVNNFTKGYYGSCLWICSSKFEAPSVVHINDCDFYSSARDEVISIWTSYASDVTLSNCNINKDNYLCYDKQGEKRINKPQVILVSKAAKRTDNDFYINLEHNVKYKNCNIIVNDIETTSDYFFSSNTYYSEPMVTEFENCKIDCNVSVSFLTAEQYGNDIDKVIITDDNRLFRQNFKVKFNRCKIKSNAPTIATTHCVNFDIINCYLDVQKSLLNMQWVSNRLINCWAGKFSKNIININNYTGTFLYLSNSYNNKIECINNTFIVDKKVDKHFTFQTVNTEKYDIRHIKNTSSSVTFRNNIFLNIKRR